MDEELAKLHAEQAVEVVHNSIRKGDFHDGVLSAVRKHAQAWGRLQQAELRLKGVYVASEVFDYFGEYKSASEVVEKAADGTLPTIRELRSPPLGSQEFTVLKRQIWLTIAWATALYRREEYGNALDVLDLGREQVEAVDPDRRALLGSRARLLYGMGQVRRQLHDHEAARRDFSEAIVFATRRFTLRTPQAELPAHRLPMASTRDQTSFERDRLLADWTIGKCLVLGLGWISYTTGHLAEAEMLMSAGYALLRGTQDRVHRAYAMLLLGAVARARAGSGAGRVEAATMIENAEPGLTDHPIYRYRASYELALALYHDPATRPRARRRAQSLLGRAGSSMRSARWKSTALVVLSRIARLDGDHKGAEQLARRAVKAVENTSFSEVQAEARIARGEALVARALCLPATDRAPLLIKAAQLFREARAKAGKNPKISAVAHLYLASLYHHLGQLSEAYGAFATWPESFAGQVEHGFVRALAAQVAQELKVDEVFVLSDTDVNEAKLRRSHVASLEAFLLRRAAKKGWSSAQTARNFGMTIGSLNKRKRELLGQNLVVPTNRRGRPKSTK